MSVIWCGSISQKKHFIALFPNMPIFGKFCCQKGCTEYTLYPLLLWLQLSLNEMKRPVTPRLLSDTMEQLLEWGRTSPWAMTLVTLLGLVSCLRMAFGLLKNLRDLIWAYILPRIWPVDLVKTYGKWVGTIFLTKLAILGVSSSNCWSYVTNHVLLLFHTEQATFCFLPHCFECHCTDMVSMQQKATQPNSRPTCLSPK